MRARLAMDRIARRLVIATACLLLSAAVGAEPPVYRATRDGAATIYLVGTMHSEDARVVSLVDRLIPLIGDVPTVALELVPDAVTLLAVTAASMLPLDRSLRDLLGERRFGAVRLAARRLDKPIEVIERLKPWAAAVALGMPASESGQFLDLQIYLEAQRQGKAVIGLETAADQLALFDDMPPALQLQLLDEVVKKADELPTQLEELTAAYLAGDLARLEQSARAQYTQMTPELGRWFEVAVVEQRNRRMLERLAEIAADGPVLIAVGALHLAGETGLIAGLGRQGYRVEPWPN